MKRLTFLFITALLGLIVVPVGQPAPPEGLDVNVVNQPRVNARQSGVWRLSVAPQEPYAAELVYRLRDGAGASPSDYLDPAVPDDKQAVLEHVSILAVLPEGQSVTGIEMVSGGWVTHFFSMIPQGTDREGRSIFTTSQPLRAYLPPGTSLQFILRRGPTSNDSAYFEMQVSGFLIDNTP
jgi:hypothetical protein